MDFAAYVSIAFRKFLTELARGVVLWLDSRRE